MTLDLQLKGSTKKFANYLKKFSKIRKTLLLELDAENRYFIAKSPTEDRASVYYSAISFDECGIVYLAKEGAETPGRIRIGIINQLDKVISILESFEKELSASEDAVIGISVTYSGQFDAEGNEVPSATRLAFSSNKVTIKYDTFRVKEFKYMSDSVLFENVMAVENPISFEFSADTINDVIGISEIVKTGERNETMAFSCDGDAIYVSNSKNPDDEKYRIKVAELEPKGNPDFALAIQRDAFIRMLSKPEGSYLVSIGANDKSKIVFDSQFDTTKVAVACLNV